MLDRQPPRQVGATLGNEAERRVRTHLMNLREVDCARLRKQSGVDVCIGLALLAAPVSFLERAGRRYLMLGIEFTERAFLRYVAVGNLRLVGIVELF